MFQGERWLLPHVIFLNGHSIRPTSCTPCGRFHTPVTEHPGPGSRVVPGMHGTHCKHNPLISSLVSNNNLSLLIYGCMCVGTLGHIHRYMGRMCNNNYNKMLINNLLCCFAIWVVYTRITVTWDIRYIDEGFLVELFLRRTCLKKP